MLNPLLSLAMSILLLSPVLKRNFFMRMEKCGTATNHSSKQAKLDWRTGNIGERKKCSWPNPVAQNTRDPFFAHPIFFSFSICHSFFHLSYMMLQTPFWKHWNLCLFYQGAELTSELNGRPSSQNVFVTDTKSRFWCHDQVLSKSSEVSLS